MAHAEPGSRYPIGCEDGGDVPQDQGRQDADGVPGGHRLWREATRIQHPPARSPRHLFARNHRRRNVSHRERRQSSRRPTRYINGIPIGSDIAVEKFPFLQEVVFLFKYLGVTV